MKFQNILARFLSPKMEQNGAKWSHFSIMPFDFKFKIYKKQHVNVLHYQIIDYNMNFQAEKTSQKRAKTSREFHLKMDHFG